MTKVDLLVIADLLPGAGGTLIAKVQKIAWKFAKFAEVQKFAREEGHFELGFSLFVVRHQNFLLSSSSVRKEIIVRCPGGVSYLNVGKGRLSVKPKMGDALLF